MLPLGTSAERAKLGSLVTSTRIINGIPVYDYRVIPREPMGKSHALEIAEKYNLTFSKILNRKPNDLDMNKANSGFDNIRFDVEEMEKS